MDIYRRRVSEKLVNRIQIQVSLPAFHGGVTEHDLCDVLLSYEVGYRLGDREYADALLHSEYQRVDGEKRFGDVVILVETGYALHACVYIADDIYYTKNGTDPNQPWVLMRMKDMSAQYVSGRPQEWRTYRHKST